MKRSRRGGWWVPVLLGASVVVYGAPPRALAQDKAALERAARERQRLFEAELARIANAEVGPGKEFATQADKTRAYDALYAEYLKGAERTNSITGAMDRLTREMENANANRPPGFWDKVGDTALSLISELLKGAIQNWLNNPNEENLRRIEELEAERDRLLNERNNPDPGTGTDGIGRPIYDDNGNVIGWDRDGDGRPDFTDSNGDGLPDSYNGGTNDLAYADPYEYLDGPGSGTSTTDDGSGGTSGTGTPGRMIDTNGDGIPDAIDTDGDGLPDMPYGNGLAGASGSGASMGGAFNGSSGVGTPGDAASGDELAAADGGAGGTPTGESGEGKRGVAGSFPKTDRDRNGDGIDDEEQLVMISGRPIVLPKALPEMAAGGVAGNRMPSGPVEDDWNDMEDNGDAEDDWGDWGDDWGDEPSTKATQPAPGVPATPRPMGSASEATKLVDQLIRVETVIAEWRKQAKEEAEGKTDPYGFGDGKGYRAGGTNKASQDPLAELRGPDGKLDLSRCEIWIIERDTWMEGKEPKRYQVTVTEDALDQFDPIQGGYIVIRGIVGDVSVDPRVIQEIKGEVKKVDVVQVVFSDEKLPEGLSGTTPSQPLPPLDDDDSGW